MPLVILQTYTRESISEHVFFLSGDAAALSVPSKVYSYGVTLRHLGNMERSVLSISMPHII